ncbi:hypothetical protein JRQ81_000384, partial [Phrynocephalus forsythii]
MEGARRGRDAHAAPRARGEDQPVSSNHASPSPPRNQTACYPFPEVSSRRSCGQSQRWRQWRRRRRWRGSGGSGSGRGLVGQVIPIYGFGILLYILYILFKLSSKGKTMTTERKCPPSGSGNTNRKITDYELAQLQEKLRETEEAMEKLINRVGPNCERAQNSTTEQEKRLLQQLREITRVMKEGKLIDGISPEQEAEEAPYMQDWEGYPEETYPVYDNSDCYKRRQDTILVDYPDPSQPSAEEIAERMEFVDDEDYLCSETLLSALAVVNDGPVAGNEKDQRATFSDQSGNGHHFEKCYCCHYEEDDPAVIAENAGFFS